ncbi:MAG: hypothetical protein U1E65_19710 [Myxococcota bacterium]
MRSRLLLFAALTILLSLAGCWAGANDHVGIADAAGAVAGFWKGLWHGMLLPLSFLVSLFSDAVQIYETHNNGGWYNFGFLLGACCSLGGSGGGAARRGRRRGGS